MPLNNSRTIIFIDDECVFCNYWGKFILKHDKSKTLYISPSSSSIFNHIKEDCEKIPNPKETIILHHQNTVYERSNAVIVIVSNPMDTMTYLTLKESGLPKNRIIGMGGALDSARFRTYLSLALDKPSNDIHGMVIGGHGDTTMIPMTRFASYNGIKFNDLLEEKVLEKVAADTMVGGKTLTGMLGTSAWYAPGAAVAFLVDSILNDQKRIIPCSVYLEGEYGQKDICIGVPVVIGRNGWENVIDLKLNEKEQDLFAKSADAVRNMNSALESI